jgi:hypothetical protein
VWQRDDQQAAAYEWVVGGRIIIYYLPTTIGIVKNMTENAFIVLRAVMVYTK